MFNLDTIRNALNTGSQTPDDADLVDAVASGRTVLIDVRNHDEVQASGKAQGAVHIPLSLLPMQADPRHPDTHPALSTDMPIAVYCASGGRSAMACQQLKRLGYGEVVNIGGLRDWQKAGGRIEK